MKARFALACLIALGGCSSAALPGAENAIDQADRAHEVQVEVDLRNAANAQEAYFAQNNSYTLDLATSGFVPSESVTVTVPQADATGYCIQGVHESGGTWHLRKSEGAVAQGPC